MAMLRSLLLVFIVFSMGNAEVGKCPNGWKNFGVRCFKFFPQMVNWITAEKNCLSLNANLASVHNEIEKDYLLSLLPSSSTRCWFGLNDGNHEGQWLWTDGTPYDYNNWVSDQPDNWHTENCVEFNINSDWNDVSCITTLSYVCAKYL